MKIEKARMFLRTALANPDEIFLPGASLQYWAGAGAGHQSYTQGYTFPNQAGASTALGWFAMPPAWVNQILYVDLFWRPADANAGDVRWGVYVMRLQDNVLHTSWTLSQATLIDATLLSADKTHVASIEMGALGSDLSEYEAWTLLIYRRTDQSDDTYAGSVYLIGVKLRVRNVSNHG